MNDSRLKRRWRGVRGLDGELTERDSQHKIEREKGEKPTTDSGVGLWGGERAEFSSQYREKGEKKRQPPTSNGARLKKRWVGVRGLDGSWAPSGFTLDVVAGQVDRTYVSYSCPFCVGTHRHGSGGETHNRVEDRSTHCRKRRPHNVRIQITDQTWRTASSTPG